MRSKWQTEREIEKKRMRDEGNKKYQQSLNFWFTSNKLLELAEKPYSSILCLMHALFSMPLFPRDLLLFSPYLWLACSSRFHKSHRILFFFYRSLHTALASEVHLTLTSIFRELCTIYVPTIERLLFLLQLSVQIFLCADHEIQPTLATALHIETDAFFAFPFSFSCEWRFFLDNCIICES